MTELEFAKNSFYCCSAGDANFVKDAVRVTDDNRACEAFAAAIGITEMALIASAGERTIGCYHVQNVNADHSRFKLWMGRFNAVALKYLPSYFG